MSSNGPKSIRPSSVLQLNVLSILTLVSVASGDESSLTVDVGEAAVGQLVAEGVGAVGVQHVRSHVGLG